MQATAVARYLGGGGGGVILWLSEHSELIFEMSCVLQFTIYKCYQEDMECILYKALLLCIARLTLRPLC